jgi:hypothetical protein
MRCNGNKSGMRKPSPTRPAALARPRSKPPPGAVDRQQREAAPCDGVFDRPAAVAMTSLPLRTASRARAEVRAAQPDDDPGRCYDSNDDAPKNNACERHDHPRAAQPMLRPIRDIGVSVFNTS